MLALKAAEGVIPPEIFQSQLDQTLVNLFKQNLTTEGEFLLSKVGITKKKNIEKSINKKNLRKSIISIA